MRDCNYTYDKSDFSSREALIYFLVKKYGGDPERAVALVPHALTMLDRGGFSREEFLDKLCRISYAQIVSEEFWQEYNAYMQQTHELG